MLHKGAAEIGDSVAYDLDYIHAMPLVMQVARRAAAREIKREFFGHAGASSRPGSGAVIASNMTSAW
jgi:hypothetical protein